MLRTDSSLPSCSSPSSFDISLWVMLPNLWLPSLCTAPVSPVALHPPCHALNSIAVSCSGLLLMKTKGLLCEFCVAVMLLAHCGAASGLSWCSHMDLCLVCSAQWDGTDCICKQIISWLCTISALIQNLLLVLGELHPIVFTPYF